MAWFDANGVDRRCAGRRVFAGVMVGTRVTLGPGSCDGWLRQDRAGCWNTTEKFTDG